MPSRKTVGSEMGAEQILECLEICKSYGVELEEYEKSVAAGWKKAVRPAPPPIMVAYKVDTPEDYILDVLGKIRSR